MCIAVGNYRCFVVFSIHRGTNRYVVMQLFWMEGTNKIQPTMFLWMLLMGWLVYFLIKFFLSAVVGLFVAPFVIGKFIGTKLYERIGES